VAVLHELYSDAVLRFVSQRVARPREAERLTAEVFASALAGLPRFRGRCPPYLWLIAIARRKIAEAQHRRPCPLRRQPPLRGYPAAAA
jgi:DNA-directed RNA polymerase specialized sigma24 family protein